jgi:hypothetical protein
MSIVFFQLVVMPLRLYKEINYILLPLQDEHPGKSSVEWHPVSVCCAQLIPRFLISGFRLTCVSGKTPLGFNSILIPNPAKTSMINTTLNISSFKNISKDNHHLFIIIKQQSG